MIVTVWHGKFPRWIYRCGIIVYFSFLSTRFSNHWCDDTTCYIPLWILADSAVSLQHVCSIIKYESYSKFIALRSDRMLTHHFIYACPKGAWSICLVHCAMVLWTLSGSSNIPLSLCFSQISSNVSPSIVYHNFHQVFSCCIGWTFTKLWTHKFQIFTWSIDPSVTTLGFSFYLLCCILFA